MRSQLSPIPGEERKFRRRRIVAVIPGCKRERDAAASQALLVDGVSSVAAGTGTGVSVSALVIVAVGGGKGVGVSGSELVVVGDGKVSVAAGPMVWIRDGG